MTRVPNDTSQLSGRYPRPPRQFRELSRCAGPGFLEADSPMDNDSSVSAPPRRMPRRCFGKRKKVTVFLVPRAPFLRIPRIRTDEPDLHADLRAGSNRLISNRFGPWSVSLSLACYNDSLPVPFVYRSHGESLPFSPRVLDSLSRPASIFLRPPRFLNGEDVCG